MLKDLQPYIPEKSIPLIENLIKEYPHHLKIVNQRQTKHGDFRVLDKNSYQITLNNNLNLYQFLLTYVHEIAHLATHIKHKRVKPHGIEWKISFQHLMLPFIDPNIFPMEILPHLANYLKNPKASTDSDVNLSLALKAFDQKKDKNFIFEIPEGALFEYKNRTFKMGNKRRTRFACVDLKNDKTYLFSQHAEVKKLTI